MFDVKLENRLKHIHGYHEKVKDVKAFIVKQQMKNTWKHKSLKEKLFNIQKGVCSYCQKTIELNKEDIQIHHKFAISKGGSRSSVKNMEILHKSCHFEQHNEHGI